MQINKNIAISDNGFLFNPATGESFSVNSTGTEMLNLIKDGKDLDQIKAIFINKYEIDANTIEKDYQEFIDLVKQHNLAIIDSKELMQS